MEKNLNDLYRELINLLDCIRIAVPDDNTFKIVRKKILDIANDIKRVGDNNG